MVFELTILASNHSRKAVLNLNIFLQALIIGYSGAIMPGSLLTYILNKSMRMGGKAGLIISVGHALLELLIVILIFLGIGDFISSPKVQMIIGFLGGLVLLYMGFDMAKGGLTGKVSIELSEDNDISYGNLIAGGALLSATNPYFIVWWATIGLGLIMTAYNLLGLWGIVLVYLGHISSDITWYIFISTLVGKTRSFINQKVYRAIIVTLGLFLLFFGFRFLLSSYNILQSI